MVQRVRKWSKEHPRCRHNTPKKTDKNVAGAEKVILEKLPFAVEHVKQIWEIGNPAIMWK
jgi:hypothetical protein